MAITYEASGSTSITPASSSWSFTPDVGTLAGDVFVVQVFTQDANANITPPAGSIATAVDNDDLQAPAGGNRVSVFAWVAPSDAPGAQTVGVSAAAAGTVTWARFRGVDTSSPFDAFQYVSDGGGSAVSGFSTPAVTTTVADCYILAGLCIDAGGSAPTLSGPSGSWTNLFPTISPRKGAMALKGVQSSPGSSGAVTGWGSSDGGTADAPRVGWQAALRPGPSGPTLRGTTVYETVGLINSNASPPTIDAPAGLAAGDLLLVAAFFAQGVATAGEGYVPDGMVKITGTPQPTTGDTRRGVIYAAVVEDPADFAGGITLRSPAQSTRVAAVALAWKPSEGKEFRLENLVVPTGTWQVTNLPGFDYPAGAIGDFVLGVAMTNKSASTTYTEHTSVGGTMLAQAQALNGASGSVSDSVTSVALGGTGVTFNINQANGIAFAVGVTEADADAPPEPLPVVTGHGFSSVSEMLQTPGATWAHRNLGGTYPEMTEYGARMAANHGHGVIEVSCLRTSDGVWVGTHDATPDRVALETTYDGQYIESLTSAQVLSLHAVVGPTGAPQPFARAIDIFQTLPEDFIFLVDPKSSGGSHMADFLNMLDTYLGPERAIVKLDGAAPLARFQAAKAAGYTVAAYFYSNTPAQTIADRMPYVDIPGMNWDAGQGVWDALLGYGKPVWGHVCTTQEQYDTCISKGATFVQCTTTAIAAVGPSPSGIWFETDFTGGAPGTEASTATEPEVDVFTYPMVYASVPNTAYQGVRPRSSGYAEARILTEGRTKWRAGIRLYFESSTTATGYYYAIGARIGSTLSFDTGLRGNSTTGNRHGSTRNNFTYVGETLPNVIEAGEIWSYELLYDEGDVTVMIWDHGLASSPTLDLSTQRAPDYTWTYTSALETPTDWYFGPSGATGVSAILFDAWATEGERREGPEPDPAVTHWAHNGSSRHDRFLVAARVEDAESVAIEYSTSPDFAGGTMSAAVTEPLTPDGHYRLEATGLTPATTYYWRLVVNGSPTGQTGRTKTLAAPGGPADMRIVWGSCYWSNASAVFPLIGAHDPDLIVQVGDDGYTFYSAGETNPNPGQPYPAPADTALIRSIRDEVFTRVGRATMTTAFPVEHMYSDCDGLGGNMDSTEGAPENVQEAWRQMYAHYLDHADTGFRTWVSGRVRFIVVDENTASDAKNSPQSPTKSKLGAAQKALLFAALDQAAADGHFVVLFGDGPWYGARDNSLSSTGIGYNKYDDERTEIGQKVQQCIADGMLGFHRYHGDDHTLYGDSGANNAWGGFPVYCAAPMNETSNTGTIATYDAGKWPTTPAEAGSARQYGVIDITDDGVTITVRTRGFSSTPSEPTEVVRYDQTLTYAEPPAEVSASGSIERGGLAVVEQPVVPPAEVSASASIVRSGAAVIDSPAIPPAEVEASTGVTRGGLAVLEAPSVPPAEVSASTALVRSGVATVATPTVPPSQVQAAASLSRGGVATVVTPTVPPAEVQAAASLSRSGVATVVTTDVPPSQVQALTMRLLAGLAIISSAPVPPAEVQAAGSIVRGGVARISNGQRVPILDPVIGPYRRRTLIDPVET